MFSSKTLACNIIRSSRRSRLFGLLLFLDGLMVGGLVTAWMIRDLIQSRCCTPGRLPVWAVYDLLDPLVPYYLLYGTGILLLGLSTLVLWVSKVRIKAG